MHLDVLRAVEMLAAGLNHSRGKEAVAEVVHRACIGRDGHYLAPLAAAVARLFHKFAARGVDGRLTILAHSGNYLEVCLAYAVTVLAYQYILAAVSNGNNVNPSRVFKHVILVVDDARWQFHGVLTCRQPRPFYKILAL